MPPGSDGNAHFGPALVLARTVALVNAAGPPATDPPTARTVEQVLRDHGEPDPEVHDRELPPLTRVLGQLFGVCRADGDDDAARRINELFGEYAQVPRLTAHDDTPWHLHLDRCDDAPLHEWVATSGALALALQLSDTGRGAWGVCRATGCGRLFLRTGPGRRRNACSERCATRTRVQDHRRHKSSSRS